MRDPLSEIGIDGDGKLYVVPASAKFPFIYREAMQVEWNAEQNHLCSPSPREWSHLQWFKQIIHAAAEQGVQLHLANSTVWKNISAELQQQIMSLSLGERGV